MSTDRAQIALIGFGMAGRVFHAPFIAAEPRLELAAIVTADAERAAEAKRLHPGAEIVAAAEHLWDRSDEFDAVVIAAPNRVHVELARAAIAAKLPLVVDKPLAPTELEAAALVTEAATAGVPLTVFQNRRWDGDFLTVQSLVRQGVLGEVHRFESRYERWRPEVADAWREDPDPAAAGGVLFDLGSHGIDQALQLLGPAARVSGEARARRAGARVDDDAYVSIVHESGAISHIWLSLVAPQAGPRFRVLGSRAAFVKWGMDPQEDALKAGAAPGGPDWGLEPIEAHGQYGTDDERELVPTRPGDYGEFYWRFAATLLDGEPPPVDPADSVAVLRIIEQIHAESGS